MRHLPLALLLAFGSRAGAAGPARHDAHGLQAADEQLRALAERNRPLDRRVDLERAAKPAAGRGVQIVAPEWTLGPRSEKLLCMFVTLDNEQPIFVSRMEPFQGAGGHHAIGVLSASAGFNLASRVAGYRDGLMFDCTNKPPTNPEDFMPVFFINSADRGFQAPAGFGVRLPAKPRVVFEFHYHNHEDRPVVVRPVVNLHFAADARPMAPWVTDSFDFEIPGGKDHSIRYECPVPRDMSLHAGYGHMHERGVSIVIERGRDGKFEDLLRAERLRPDQTAAAGLRVWEKPHEARKGDVLRVTCTWRSERPVKYPDEMCATTFFVDGEPLPLCRAPSIRVP